jgi:hypothetical protein
MPRHLAVFLVLALTVLLTGGRAHAALILVTSRAALAGTDNLNWGNLGATGTTVSSPFVINSTNASLPVTVSQPGGSFERRDQGNGWNGNFSPGDKLLWTENFNTGGGGPITVNFGATPLDAFGSNIMADFFGAFTAQLDLFDSGGNPLGSVSEAGNSTGAGDGSAIFIGVRSDDPSTNFSRVVIRLTAAVSNVNDFAINRADFTPAPAAVPEPGTLALTGLGMLGMGVWLRKRRKLA